MIEENVKQKILKDAVSLSRFGVNDIFWEKENAKYLIISLMEDDIGILGGNVYKIDSKKLIPMYDNWFCESKQNETKKEYFLRSKLIAFEYINKYTIYDDEKILFSIGFTEFIDTEG